MVGGGGGKILFENEVPQSSQGGLGLTLPISKKDLLNYSCLPPDLLPALALLTQRD